MRILWKYLKPQQMLIFYSLLAAGVAQLLSLIDPVIFGKIIDDYANNPNRLPQSELINGVLKWLSIAIGVALLARVFKSVQEYLTRMAVARFGMQIFNDGLRQTLRLSFQEFEESRSGETLSILQKSKNRYRAFCYIFHQHSIFQHRRYWFFDMVQRHEKLDVDTSVCHWHFGVGRLDGYAF